MIINTSEGDYACQKPMELYILTAIFIERTAAEEDICGPGLK